MELIVILVLFLLSAIIITRSFHTVPANEKWVVERLGAYHMTWEPGLHCAVPLLDRIARKVPMSDQTIELSQATCCTRDRVEILADVSVLFRIMDARLYTYGVDDVDAALKKLIVNTLSNFIGTLNLEECLANRDKLNAQTTLEIDKATDSWGIMVKRVDITSIRPPREIQESLDRMNDIENKKRKKIAKAKADNEIAQTSPPNGDKLIEMVTQDNAIYEKLINKILLDDKLSDKFIEKTAQNAKFVNKLNQKSKSDSFSFL